MPTHLTDRFINSVEPTGKRSLIFDDEIEGLALMIRPSGAKSWVFTWTENGRQRRVTLGRFPTWTVGKARTHAGRMRLKADVGEEVVAARGSSVGELIKEWRKVVKLTRRPGTVVGYELAIDNYIVPTFGKDQPKAVTRNRIEAWHGEMAQTTPIQANRALGVLSAFMSWLEHDKLVERNVCRGVRRCPENQRHVYLTAEQIASAHEALRGDNDRAAGVALRLSLMSGCRVGEAIGLMREQLDVPHLLWVKPASSTKQKKVHILPLQKEAMTLALELLELGGTDYESCKRAWKRARKVIGRPDVRIHDLRHSRASALARKRASLPQIGKVLGHTSPQTTQRYAHLVAADLVDLINEAE